MRPCAAVYGAGGHSRVIASILRSRNIPILGFFDDSYRGHEIIQGSPVLGIFQDILDYKSSINSVYIAVGDNTLRKKAFDFLSENQFCLPPLIHPKATVEIGVNIDQGSVVCIGSIVGTEARIGKGAIVNTGCSIDHETHIGDFVHLAPKAVIAGRSNIGTNTFIGMNACIGDRLTIGKNVTVGAGAIVLRDVPDGVKIVGIYH